VTWLPITGFVVVALIAVAFAALPLWRVATGKARALLLGAVALFVLGIGGGVYWMVGQPRLAQRDARGLKNDERDVRALIPPLIKRVRATPNDDKAWRYLASAYMSANDPANAAKALAKVIELTGKSDPVLDAAYGESLVLANDGAVPSEAEAAFQAALQVDPRSAPARFYLGLARAQHRDNNAALAYWRSLLEDIPANSSLHQVLVNRMAMLASQTGAVPQGGPQAMVAQLAARLKANPNDALGWVRLINAYTVLGEMDKARAALASARRAFAGNKDAQTAFDTIARQIK
jgi:cytochrome c-type biogenesis protein CcmH